MELEEEDDVAGFLGLVIQVQCNQDGTITLSQYGLVQRIVKALNIGHLPKKSSFINKGSSGQRYRLRSTGRNIQLCISYQNISVSTMSLNA